MENKKLTHLVVLYLLVIIKYSYMRNDLVQ
jgi:hypothetical protein